MKAMTTNEKLSLLEELVGHLGLGRALSHLVKATSRERMLTAFSSALAGDDEDMRVYVENHGMYCPQCCSPDTEGGRFYVENGIVTRRVSCDNCDAAWTDRYALIGYQDLKLERV